MALLSKLNGTTKGTLAAVLLLPLVLDQSFQWGWKMKLVELFPSPFGRVELQYSAGTFMTLERLTSTLEGTQYKYKRFLTGQEIYVADTNSDGRSDAVIFKKSYFSTIDTLFAHRDDLLIFDKLLLAKYKEATTLKNEAIIAQPKKVADTYLL